MSRILMIGIMGLLLCPSRASGQDTTASLPARYAFSGYIKDLVMLVDDPFTDNYFYANQLHNRLRFSWFPSQSLTTRIELRNRFYTGSLVEENPGFADALGEDPGWADLTFSSEAGDFSAAVAAIDRAWIGFRKGRWDLTAGRQRINWGVNTVWNPNDVFNAYNVFDFDYEERPGSDALRIQFTTGDFSFLEGAVSKGSETGDLKYAVMSRLNVSGYDVQLLAGVDSETPFAGLGWAGNILKAGFKTEATWYFNSGNRFTRDQLIVSSGIDYTFKNGWYVNAAGLYNSRVRQQEGSAMIPLQLPDEPFPFELAGFLQVMKEISPIVSAGISSVYTGDQLLVILPNITWSIASDWDLLLYGQYYTKTGEMSNNGVNGFLRLRWSFSR